jgi:tRNA threonylcarbamoyladenosine biosynthesis protein TsaE
MIPILFIFDDKNFLMSNLINYQLSNIDKVSTQIIENAKNNKIWLFFGEMGAGKTTLIKSICKNLGVSEEINSPTFSIVNEYKTINGKTIYHFDFYRVKSIEEVYDMGIEDYFKTNNICLIEWPNKIDEILNDEITYKIEINMVEENRFIKIN